MALKAFGAFATGIVVGWTGRTVFGSTRELMVQTLVVAHHVRGKVKRMIAERFESAEDLFAEGRARYEATEGGSPDDVDEVAEPRGRAA
jgi:hypothetical protein